MSHDVIDAPRRALHWLFAIQLVSMGAMEMSGPFWPLYLRDLGGLQGTALAWASALAYGGPLFMAMCFTPAWGRLADRLGHKPMVLRALLALAATQAWIGFADSVVSVLCARIVQGALAGFIAAAQAYGVQLCDRSGRARMIARLQVATAAGAVVGPPAGGLMFEAIGFRSINLVAAVLCVACALTACFVLPSTPQPAKGGAGATGSSRDGAARAHGVLIGLLLGIVAVQSARMMPQAFFGLYAEKVLAMPAWGTGLCYGATALGLCIGAPLWARRIDRSDRARMLAESAVIAWVCALLTLAQAAAVPVPLLIGARFGWGLALGALLPVFYALLSREAPDHAQGSVLGWGNSAAKAGALIGSLLGGLIVGWLPLPWLMWPVAAAYVVAAAGLYLLRRRLRATSIDASAPPLPAAERL